MNDPPNEDVKPNRKIEIIVTFEGKSVKFSLKRTSPLRKALDVFAKQFKMDIKTLRFTYDGETIRPDDEPTPESLGMNDGDEIDAYVSQIGGTGGCTDSTRRNVNHK